MTPEQFCASMVRLRSDECTYHSRCCSSADRAAMGADPTRFCQPDRLQAEQAACERVNREGINARRRRFDETKAARCIATLRAQAAVPPTCQGLGPLASGRARPDEVPACHEAFVGLVPTGGRCEDNDDCASNAVCRRGEGGHATGTERVCIPRLAVGASCGGDTARDCPVGMQCIDDTCRAPRAADEPCNGFMDCQRGLRCAPAGPAAVPGAPGVCQRPREIAAECSIHSQCASFACRDGHCAAVCTAP